MWNLLSWLIIGAFSVLQAARWKFLPQFMDAYYHLLTAWGFIQAGGWSTWDFWQYAPAGRVHIYPPLFHVILAGFIKAGVAPLFLAKVFECCAPVAFLLVLWIFIRRNYGRRLAFFTLAAAVSSFPFYANLINHLPATLAFIWGFASIDQFLRKKSLAAGLFLALCFYSHIGVSWFFFFALLIYALCERSFRRAGIAAVGIALAVSSPLLLQQALGLKDVSHLGLVLSERDRLYFKITEYLLAGYGLVIALRRGREYRLYLAFSAASLLYLTYPYRFFSGEGYLPVIFLCGLGLDALWERFEGAHRYGRAALAALVLLVAAVSPAVRSERPGPEFPLRWKFEFSDSAFAGMAFPLQKSPDALFSPVLQAEQKEAARIIRQNSAESGIVYASIDMVGVALASFSGRATANGLLTEIDAASRFDPFAAATIIVTSAGEDERWFAELRSRPGIIPVGQTKLFTFYKNTAAADKSGRPAGRGRRAWAPFWLIGVSLGIIAFFLARGLKNS